MSSIKRLIKFFIFLRFSSFSSLCVSGLGNLPSAGGAFAHFTHHTYMVAALRESPCNKLAQAFVYINLYNFDITIICLVNIAMFRFYLTAIVAYLLLLWTRHMWLSIVSKSLSPFVNPRITAAVVGTVTLHSPCVEVSHALPLVRLCIGSMVAYCEPCRFWVTRFSVMLPLQLILWDRRESNPRCFLRFCHTAKH